MHKIQSQEIWFIAHVSCPSFYQNTRDNDYLIHVHHVVYRVSKKSLMKENGLWHNKFSRPDARHIYYVAHYTLCLSNFFFIDISCVLRHQKCHFCVICLTSVFEIPVLNSRQYFLLLFVMPFLYQTFHYRGGGQCPPGGKLTLSL